MARSRKTKIKRSLRIARAWLKSIRMDTVLWVIGALFILSGLIALIALAPEPLPALFSTWKSASSKLLGDLYYVSFLPFIVFGILFILMAMDRLERFPIGRSVGLLLLFAMLDGILGWATPGFGGSLGGGVARVFDHAFGRAGALIMMLALGGLSTMLALDTSIVATLQRASQWASRKADHWREQRRLKSGPKIAVPTPAAQPARTKTPPATAPRSQPAPAQPTAIAEPTRIQVEGDVDQVWTLPAFATMLDDHGETQLDVTRLRERAILIESTLNSLSIPGTVEEVNPGPTVTQYGIKPGYLDRMVRGSEGTHARVKVSSIQNAANDLALALAARSIRVEAPIPGKSLVGLEIPNEHPAVVGIRSILESTEMRNAPPLTVTLGRDVSGQPVLVDIARLPHLLIAGATGAGKSICINALVTCLLCRNTPLDLRLLMVDPKRVELTGYNGVPHLLTDVVVEPDRVVGLLAWLVGEMESRYKQLHAAKVRNIDGYNQSATAQGKKKLPYIICIIDELADLMMVASEQVETQLCRIAQMARAVGIHLILATQRPSVDVITGTIKTNFSARLAFAVSSNVDSRVILDTPGAETLLGKGDSLFMHPEKPGLKRIQGCLVTDDEIGRITSFWKDQKTSLLAQRESERAATESGGLPPVQQPLWPEIDTTVDKDRDEMLDRAIDLAHKEGSVSVSMLQRKMSIGYTRASRIVDQMEEDGIIGPYTTQNKPREVLRPLGAETNPAAKGDS